MPKMKSRRAIAKRFKRTKKGKIKRSRAFSGHIKTKKSGKRKRFLRGRALVSKGDAKKIKRQMPGW
ncbi:MAG: 50S ribosomal protein L35 [Candidatus Omnitrophota bacterium]